MNNHETVINMNNRDVVVNIDNQHQIDFIPKFKHRTSLKIKGYYDYEPKNELNKIYFGLDKKNTLHTDDRKLPILIIGVAFYNEHAIELRRTLVSLAKQVKELKDNVICQVVFVSDGHQQMADDTKEFLRHIFCSTVEESENWDTLMNSLDVYCQKLDDANEDERRETALEQATIKPPDLTYILQKVKRRQRKLVRSSVNIPGAKDGKLRRLPLS